MAEHEDTKRTHGFEDHFHVAPAKPSRLDKNYRAPKELKDAVWDQIQGKATTVQDEPGTITIPDTYVQTIATMALKELKRLGCTRGFSVAVDPDEPKVKLSWTRAETIARTGGGMRSGYDLEVDAYTAFINDLDPVDVGANAARAFVPAIEKAMQAR